jgi:hypothetical protein
VGAGTMTAGATAGAGAMIVGCAAAAAEVPPPAAALAALAAPAEPWTPVESWQGVQSGQDTHRNKRISHIVFILMQYFLDDHASVRISGLRILLMAAK